MRNIRHCASPSEIGTAAALLGAAAIRTAIATHGEASIIVATGASQFATIGSLVSAPGIDWGRVTVFHLDEYIGLPESHKASFRGYLRDRLLAHLPTAPHFVPVIGDAPDVASEITRLTR